MTENPASRGSKYYSIRTLSRAKSYSPDGLYIPQVSYTLFG
jgi:hypothetical protein